MDDNTKIVKYFCKNQHSFMLSFYLIQARRNQGEEGGCEAAAPPPPKVFARVDLFPTENDSEKKKSSKKI